ncbi:MAG TPA: M23 family metallopeptidase [Aquihabitans sp.]|jgi:murein DD-endopeptidase MepM/ murein hydrolase activator NlpD|nr:M23 family metallopeptidase [Aquihabitans sp.]
MTCHCDHDDPGPAPGHRRLGRRAVLAGGMAAGLAPLLPGIAGAQAPTTETAEGSDPVAGTRDFGFLPPRPASEVHQRNIMFPVLADPNLGGVSWTDTYLAPRSSGRLHEGQDLMGRKMLKLLACVDGTIVELRHQSGGNSLYLKGTDGYYYCYLHVNNDRPGTDDGSNLFANAFAPGMAIGKAVKRGDLLGYLGDSGNAEGTGAHLHFEIRLPNARWYNAAACNAKYSLQAAQPAKVGGTTSYAPFPDALAFTVQQADDLLGGVPSWEWLSQKHSAVEGGRIGQDAFIESLLADDAVIRATNPVIRLHVALYGWIPSASSVALWTRMVRDGTTVDAMADQCAVGSTFVNRWGRLDNRAYARRVQVNLIGLEPSAATLDSLTSQLNRGMSRGKLARQQCESSYYRMISANRVRVISVYQAMVKRSPDSKWLGIWAERDRTDAAAMRALINAHRTSAAYAARFQ